MRLCDVGAAIQEVMESYEVEINGKTFQGIILTDNFEHPVRDAPRMTSLSFFILNKRCLALALPFMKLEHSVVLFMHFYIFILQLKVSEI